MSTILDQYGNPLPSQQVREAAAVQLRGGHLPYTDSPLNPGWEEVGDSSEPAYRRYGVTRQYARRTARTLYRTNGLFSAAVDISRAMLVGDDLRYGNVADPGLQEIIDDFWMQNSFEELLGERLMTEWFLDGELAVVFPNGADAPLPGPDEPATIGVVDVDHSGFRLLADTAYGATAGDMATRIELRELGRVQQAWERGQFAWAATGSGAYNNPRGWPIAYAAAEAAVAYIATMNMRMNVHALQQRILAVYKAYIDPNGTDKSGNPDGGRYEWRRKTLTFGRIPRQGGVMPVMIRGGYTDAMGNKHEAVEEDLKFLNPASGAADAATDMRLMLRLVGLCMGGLPEHWLGEGGNATRTTAESMGLPAVRLARLRQAVLRSFLNRLFRAEVVRRAGDRQWKKTKGSRKKVPLHRIELPFLFPEIREDSLPDIISRVQLALENGLISTETAQADLGYDPALEAERLTGQGPAPEPNKPNSDKGEQ